jgi:hypothetical protein
MSIAYYSDTTGRGHGLEVLWIYVDLLPPELFESLARDWMAELLQAEQDTAPAERAGFLVSPNQILSGDLIQRNAPRSKNKFKDSLRL